ncbi:homoserine O-acetyltransferase [Roseivirga misakiensis]|uniref:Probable acyltransferase n=1 Tax=Roseivirga misakiensis TaxID=1563681 RepID=A0A1E5T3Z1_9BACT|nr:homoserine O-acetyltransferase [Roseivirga misakiensis]
MDNPSLKYFKVPSDFTLESGTQLQEAIIAYHTFGRLNAKKDNVVWVCHALTANANPMQWWPGLIGSTNLINPDEHFIVCANVLGSCYGSTGPKNFNPETGERYLRSFPTLTIKDMVKAHGLLMNHLGIDEIFLGIGGSMGGQQVIEWAVESPDVFKHIALIASSAKSSPWGVAIRSAQRMAIEADPSFFSSSPKGGWKGLEAARAMAMTSYRTDTAFNKTQAQQATFDEISEAESYQRYQGEKLRNRFDARTYYTLSQAMDFHDISKKYKSIAEALSRVQAKALIIGIEEDLLFSKAEQSVLADGINQSELHFINSAYGHDGFLVEAKAISALLKNFLNKHK